MSTTLEIRRVVVSEEEISDSEYVWTVSKFQNELFQYLANFTILLDNNGDMVQTHPYYDQACDLMYFIPVLKPTPIFEINRSDLSKEIRTRMIEFENESRSCPHLFDEAIVNSIGKLFENLNARYYHESVKKCLKVKFV